MRIKKTVWTFFMIIMAAMLVLIINSRVQLTSEVVVPASFAEDTKDERLSIMRLSTYGPPDPNCFTAGAYDLIGVELFISIYCHSVIVVTGNSRSVYFSSETLSDD